MFQKITKNSQFYHGQVLTSTVIENTKVTVAGNWLGKHEKQFSPYQERKLEEV